MKVRYWRNFTKRKNSTKIPTSESYYEIDCYFKEDTSLENPTLVINGNIVTWSYAYLPDFSRYYFVTDIKSITNNHYEVSLTLDALGTFRDSIFSYTAFVERSASNYDIMVPDTALSMQQDIVYSNMASTRTILNPIGVFIVPVSGKSGLQLCCFDNMTAAGRFFDGLNYKDASGNIPAVDVFDDLFTAIGFSFFNIQDFMGAPYWLPINKADLVIATNNVTAGMFETNISCDIGGVYEIPPITEDLNIPANYYNDWRSRDPRYSHYNMFLPGVGMVELNTYDAAENNLSYTMSLDIPTGNVNYVIENDSGAIIASFDGSLAVPLPFGKFKMDWGAPITETAKGAVQGAMAGAGAGAVIGAVSGFIAGVDALMSPQISICAGGGNMLLIQDRPAVYVSVENYGSKEYPVTEFGRPYCQHARLGNLSGFVKCANASVPMNALDHVRDEVNSALNTGIYIE